MIRLWVWAAVWVLSSWVLLAEPALGEPVTVGVARSVVLSADVEGVTRLVLQFDVPVLAPRAGGRIDKAFLTFDMEGMAGEGWVTLELYDIRADYDLGEVSRGAAELITDSISLDVCEAPREESEKKRVYTRRFRVTDLVERWMKDPDMNYGLIISTSDLSAVELQELVAGVQLRLWGEFGDP